MWKYLDLRQNNVDPSPEAREKMVAAVDFCFKFSEYTLIAGVFAFLAIETKNWAVITIAIVLMVLLFAHLLSLISGLQYFVWRKAKFWWSKTILLMIDSTIFVGIFWLLREAVIAVIGVMSKGIGI